MKIDRKKLIKEMRKQKKSYGEIGTALGLSRQRVHQIYMQYTSTPRDLVESIKVRDEKKCLICDSIKNLEVHHINGVRKDNHPHNLATVCRKCHTKIGIDDYGAGVKKLST